MNARLLYLIFTISLISLYPAVNEAQDIDLFILAGQSNAQGWMGDAANYPNDPQDLDESILLNWSFYNRESSEGQWVSMQSQRGRFPDGHFGLEVSFSRELKKAGFNPAIFKYSLGGSGLARDWKAPGENGIYDHMIRDLMPALEALESKGYHVNIRGFIWIQGESDAGNHESAMAYQKNLEQLLTHLRDTVLHAPDMKIILGLDEQHKFVQERPIVIEAQQTIANQNRNIIHTSMYGLPKADRTHLTPAGLVEHGKRIFTEYKELYDTDESLKKWSAPYRKWHYFPDLVIPSNPYIPGYPEVKMTDVPTVFQIPGDDKWYMSFIGFDGQGYQSFIAESTDLVHWDNYHLAMGYGPEGSFDYGGVVLGAYLYEDFDIKAPRLLKKEKGKYISLYGAYPRQGGYELRPGYEGIAWSDDGFQWERVMDEPILSVHQLDCGEWEKSCIYQPWLVEHKGQYYNFYNAANGKVEQLGLALSNNLLDWKRYAANPVIPNGLTNSYNEVFSSDMKVFRDGDHWTGFFFGVGQGGAHVMIAFSKDLYHWSVDPEPLYKAGGNPSGIDSRYAHKISLIWNPKDEAFYMFYCAVDNEGNRGIGLIRSKKFKL